MTDTARYRLYLDLASGVLGLTAGLLFVGAGVVGLPSVAGVAAPVAAMGLLGAGFSAVGVGHFYLEDDVRGAGEFVAGVGAILVGLSFAVSQGIPVFAAGALMLIGGGLILVADNFGIGQ
jgi:hypothetical protein